MNRKPHARFAKPKPTKAAMRVGLLSVLQWRDSLDNLDVEGLARSYGMKPNEVRAMIAIEQNRRATRNVG